MFTVQFIFELANAQLHTQLWESTRQKFNDVMCKAALCGSENTLSAGIIFNNSDHIIMFLCMSVHSCKSPIRYDWRVEQIKDFIRVSCALSSAVLVCLLYSAQTPYLETLQPVVHHFSWHKKMSYKTEIMLMTQAADKWFTLWKHSTRWQYKSLVVV